MGKTCLAFLPILIFFLTSKRPTSKSAVEFPEFLLVQGIMRKWLSQGHVLKMSRESHRDAKGLYYRKTGKLGKEKELPEEEPSLIRRTSAASNVLGRWFDGDSQKDDGKTWRFLFYFFFLIFLTLGMLSNEKFDNSVYSGSVSSKNLMNEFSGEVSQAGKVAAVNLPPLLRHASSISSIDRQSLLSRQKEVKRLRLKIEEFKKESEARKAELLSKIISLELLRDTAEEQRRST